ncbi:MAG: alpha,alpha-phosphotrehalase [Bifidobacterium merycicum]|uniref:alpha,alpha-phosphotrehalase n=1 Tax=Bifidobacterium merycicum TaxID=78345 RepID=UPI002E79353D|nr:alpha,alpha-phosphotrehalase [Bifidobacterium merycicum]MEE1294275.1 alpha,alpha-phosphotrehalase [Bifidobacterium merycicum]
MNHSSKPRDFRKSVVYQIYPKSFRDSDGDGLGDINGVIEKLDYIRDLGVDCVWLTPFFVSPQYDNGYDVADYYNIDPRYGTMGDVERLIAEADRRGIGLMFDMVFNHVSTDHEWFRKAIAGDPYYKDFFFFRKGKGEGCPPTNWASKFGGSAWQYVPEFDEYYLHLFDRSQADLNWENENVRREIRSIVRFWMDKGVKGFRFDVINLVSKAAFEDDPKGDGRRFYTDGPKIHRYLRELNATTFGTDARIVTVGEMSSTSMEECYWYAGHMAGALSMVFSFHHLKVGFAGDDEWVIVPPDFAKLKRVMFDWQTGMADHDAWNAVFWCNHDQPRIVSRFGDDGRYWRQSATMLATIIHCLRGTPYVYQGEELGMTNADFTRIDQFRDVESLNYHRILQDRGLNAKDAMRIVQIHSHDNARTPMQWDGSRYAGFMDEPERGARHAKPWIGVNANHTVINVEKENDDPDSILNYYRALIALRKKLDIIAYGDVEPLAPAHPSMFAYRRRHDGHELIVAANLHGKDCMWEETPDLAGFERVLGNYPNQRVKAYARRVLLRLYEANVWYR